MLVCFVFSSSSPVAILFWREICGEIGYSQYHTQNAVEVWPEVLVYRKFNILGQRLQLNSTWYWQPLFADDTSDLDNFCHAVVEDFILLLGIKCEIDDLEL
jgi:hypothetical protein